MQVLDISIDVAARIIKKRGEIVVAVNEKTLYMLEPGHPLIDFVLASLDTLFVIQVLTQHIVISIQKVSVNLPYNHTTVLHHYRSLRLCVVYIYLTTAENLSTLLL